MIEQFNEELEASLLNEQPQPQPQEILDNKQVNKLMVKKELMEEEWRMKGGKGKRGPPETTKQQLESVLTLKGTKKPYVFFFFFFFFFTLILAKKLK